jgi:riboflavin kinase/FMN adenylyltransferase
MKGRDFIDLVKNRAPLEFLAVGLNFRCGFGLDTGAADIRDRLGEAGIPVEVLPPVMEGGEPVSSSRVRGAIRSGDLSLAAALLGRPPVLDLSDLPGEDLPGEGGRVFDPGARFRVCPPPGRYGVRFPGGAPGTALIEGGKIAVPPPFGAGRLEFLYRVP